MIKVGAWGFWDGFNRDDHFFLRMMKKMYGDNEVVPHNDFDCDVAFIAENYLPKEIDSSKTRVVSFMAEPKPVDYDNKNIHLYLSFDPTNYKRNNIRLPLWFLYLDFFGIQNQTNPMMVVCPSECDSNRWTNKERTKFCVAPYSNMVEPRIQFHQLLSSYEQTDGFGLPHGNGDSDRNEFKKCDFISDYRFCMSFENTMKIGYVTEKLLQAKISGCIPIYWGSDYSNVDFNPECFINVNAGGFSSGEDIMEYIKHINENENVYHKIRSEPLFKYDATEQLNTIIERFSSVLNV